MVWEKIPGSWRTLSVRETPDFHERLDKTSGLLSERLLISLTGFARQNQHVTPKNRSIKTLISSPKGEKMYSRTNTDPKTQLGHSPKRYLVKAYQCLNPMRLADRLLLGDA